jgi:hypothetical protein
VQTTAALVTGVMLSALAPAIAGFLLIEAVESDRLGWRGITVAIIAVWAVGLCGIVWLVRHRDARGPAARQMLPGAGTSTATRLPHR